MKIFRVFVMTSLFAAICMALIWKMSKEGVSYSLIKRSMSDKVLSFFSEDIKALSKEQIVLQQKEVALASARLDAQKAEVDAQAAFLPFKMRMRKIGAIAYLSAGTLSILIVAFGVSIVLVRKGSVFVARVNGSEYPILHSELKKMMPAVMGDIQAKIQAALAVQDEAVQSRSREVLHDMTGLYRAVCGRRGLGMLEHVDQTPALAVPAPTRPVPTFRELLQSRELAPGKPMILGYIHGVPRRGSFLDIYSAAVAGESGSGKTSTMLFLIGSALISAPVRFWGIDPHYPHPRSLGAQTKTLWEAGLMKMATFKDDMLAVLADVEQTIDRRLAQHDTDETPVVLVIDELASLSKTQMGAQIAHTMERISTEGRKCAVYMLASSQTWLAARTGESSVVRDTLTSAYVHRIKPKQANLLLQDRDEAEKVKKYVKQAGEALLCPVGGESVVVRMPYTTEDDFKMVIDLVNSLVNTPVNSQPVDYTVDQSGQHTGLVKAGSVDLVDQVQKTLQNKGDFSALVKSTGLPAAYVSRILKHKQAMSRNAEERFRAWMEKR